MQLQFISTLLLSATEEHTTFDASEVYLDIQASGVEVQEREFLDSDTVYLDLSVTSVDTAQFVDAQTVGLLLTVTATEIHNL